MLDAETKPKLAALLLVVSMVLYAASLTMNVARVTGNVRLDSEAIKREIQTQIADPKTLKTASDEITDVVVSAVRNEFPMFANDFLIGKVAQGVEEQVKRRGPQMIEGLMPQIEVPQPDEQVRRMKLLQTIRELWEHGDEFLAVCLIAFTIFFPITKYLALSALLVNIGGRKSRQRALAWLKNWGQWSMGDVFVVAFLVVYLRINTSVVSTSKLAEITVQVAVETGMYLFAASVILTMFCSMLVQAEKA